MKIKELVNLLLEFNSDQEVEICCYISINDADEMIVYSELGDKYGNHPCQIQKKITYVGLETDKKTVCIG